MLRMIKQILPILFVILVFSCVSELESKKQNLRLEIQSASYSYFVGEKWYPYVEEKINRDEYLNILKTAYNSAGEEIFWDAVDRAISRIDSHLSGGAADERYVKPKVFLEVLLKKKPTPDDFQVVLDVFEGR